MTTTIHLLAGPGIHPHDHLILTGLLTLAGILLAAGRWLDDWTPRSRR